VRREKTYAKGGVVSVTSRILVVDMLNKKLPIHLVSGMVVLHAERCEVDRSLAVPSFMFSLRCTA
jgi:hypothetical protein